MPTSEKVRVLYLPNRLHSARVFNTSAFYRLTTHFDLTQLAGDSDDNCTSREVAEAIPGFAALITGWETPPLTHEVFERADQLRIIVHSAGSVKRMLRDCARDCVIPRGICVFSANDAIALNVAEHTVGLMIVTIRGLLDYVPVTGVRPSQWRGQQLPAVGSLSGSTVGIVGAGAVGRKVIEMLRPFDVRVLVYDPYLTDADSAVLAVTQVDLLDLFLHSDVVSVHAPLLSGSRSLIGRSHFAALRDGAVFINTARAGLIDEPALIRELETGRISAVLDVTEQEPLPTDSPLLSLRNLLVTPHIAGNGPYGDAKIGDDAVRALEDFFAGRPVKGAVDFDRYDALA